MAFISFLIKLYDIFHFRENWKQTFLFQPYYVMFLCQAPNYANVVLWLDTVSRTCILLALSFTGYFCLMTIPYSLAIASMYLNSGLLFFFQHLYLPVPTKQKSQWEKEYLEMRPYILFTWLYPEQTPCSVFPTVIYPYYHTLFRPICLSVLVDWLPLHALF
jgi:hypothetical protein